MRRQFLKIYKKAAIKNRYRFAYGKSGERYHVDHIYPLHGETVSGLHVPWNLHVIPATVNMAKGTMIVDEYVNKPKYDPHRATRGFLDWFEYSLRKSDKQEFSHKS